jgi:hypothetical protein
MKNRHIKNLLTKSIKDNTFIKSLSKKECEKYLFHLKHIEKTIVNSEPEIDKMWKNILNQTSEYKQKSFTLIHAISYAASIILILVSAYFLYTYYTKESKPTEIATNEIKKIKTPSIILSTGEIVKLNNKAEGNLYQSEKISISKNKNKTVSYINNDKENLKPVFNTIVVPRGSSYSIKLSDGSMIRLNAETRLKYPVQFIGDKRQVWINGEAFFEITKDKKMPFIVNLDSLAIEVLGTKFNVNTYTENKQIATTLVEGKVKLSSSSQSILLEPNQQAILRKGNLTKHKVQISNYISWINGVFSFDEISLKKLMINIRRWYNIDYEFIDKELENKIFTGVIKKEMNLENLLNIIERVSRIKTNIKNQKIYIKKI